MRLFFSSLFFSLFSVQTLLFVSILDVSPGKAWAEQATSTVQAAATPTKVQSSEESLLNQGKYQEVIDQLSPHIAELDAKQLKYLGRAYSGVKNALACIKTLNLALAKNPKDAETNTLIGLEQMSIGGKSDHEALLSFREALKIDPHYEPAYLAIEKIYVNKANKYELRMLYTDMIDILGEKPQYVARLCEIYNMSGLYEDAKTTCLRGIKLDKNFVKNYIYLATTYKEQGEKEKSAELFKKIVVDFPKSDEVQLAFAQDMDSDKNYSEAAKYYKKTLELNPNSLRAWVGLALNDTELERYQEAYEALDHACQLDRRSIKEVHRVQGVLRVMKEEKWVEKLEALAEKCGLASYESKSTK